MSETWLHEPEAAKHCRCKVTAFRSMRIPANNSGGRKVYSVRRLDAALEARPWQRSTSAANRTTSTGARMAVSSGDPLDRLAAVRQRPYKPRKRPSLQG